MPIITKKEAELKDFVIVKDKKSNSISRIIAPHALQIGIDGFAKSGLIVKGNEIVEGSLTILDGVKGAFTLPGGAPSVRAGAGMSVVALASGAIILSTLEAVNNNIFVGRGITSSSSDLGITLSLLPEFRPAVAGSGLNSAIVNDTISLSIDRTDIVSFAGGTFTGAVIAAAGLSGSLRVLSDGITSYLKAGTGIEIVTSSNGQIQISSTVTSSSVGIAIGAELIMNEALSGTANGANNVFTINDVPTTSASFMLWMNGQLLSQGADYHLSGTTISFINGFVPRESDVLRTMYSKQTITKLYSFNEAPTALVTSGSLMTGIQLSKKPDPSSSLMLFVNGQLMTQGNNNDYTLEDKIITFNAPFLANDVIQSTFSYVV